MDEQRPDKFDMDTVHTNWRLTRLFGPSSNTASDANPGLRGQITLAVETYITKLNPQSEREGRLCGEGPGPRWHRLFDHPSNDQ